MILVATGALTIFHPGRCFLGYWNLPASGKDQEAGCDLYDTDDVTPPKTPVAVAKEFSSASAEEFNVLNMR